MERIFAGFVCAVILFIIFAIYNGWKLDRENHKEYYDLLKDKNPDGSKKTIHDKEYDRIRAAQMKLGLPVNPPRKIQTDDEILDRGRKLNWEQHNKGKNDKEDKRS